MEKKLFVLYSNGETIFAQYLEAWRIIAWARDEAPPENPCIFATLEKNLDAAEKFLMGKYKAFATYDASMEGMDKFLTDARDMDTDGVLAVTALLSANVFVEEAKKEVFDLLKECKHTAIKELPLPNPEDKNAVEAYKTKIDYICNASIMQLRTHFENKGK